MRVSNDGLTEDQFGLSHVVMTASFIYIAVFGSLVLGGRPGVEVQALAKPGSGGIGGDRGDFM